MCHQSAKKNQKNKGLTTKKQCKISLTIYQITTNHITSCKMNNNQNAITNVIK